MTPRSLLPLLLLAACTPEPEGPPRYTAEQMARVDLICPGASDGRCDFAEDSGLQAGAAALTTTPLGYETWIDENDDGGYTSAIDTFLDCGLDRLCPQDPGYVGPDAGEADGSFQALWLAGFDNSRPMADVADDTWARATVLIQGNTTLGVVALDTIGLFYNEVQAIRERARTELGIDHVVLVSTHVHETPDTMGQWGRSIAISGVNPAHMAWLHDRIHESLRQAQAAAVPVTMRLGSYRIPDAAWQGSGVNNVNIDTRDPAITDDEVVTARFVDAAGATVAAWVNYGNHPEASGSGNLSMTSDFPHTLRLAVEEGLDQGPEGPLAGFGGVALYLQGAVGGMMTPLHCDTWDLDGARYRPESLEKAYAVGRVLGYHALQAFAADRAAEAPRLSFRTRSLMVPVENAAFHVMLNADVFDRPGFNYDPDSLVSDENRPDLQTELDLLEVGDLSVLTIPGELLPELAIGGYDGSHTGPLQVIVEPGNPNPPDLAAAPEGPYLKDLMPGATKMIFGLANDEIGYLVPPYNYVLSNSGPYFNEAPGDHYEETNSVGPTAVPRLLEIGANLLEFSPPEL